MFKYLTITVREDWSIKKLILFIFLIFFFILAVEELKPINEYFF